jgi:hypothetical protein
MCVCMYVCMHVCVCVFVCVCVLCVYVYTCICGLLELVHDGGEDVFGTLGMCMYVRMCAHAYIYVCFSL